MKKIIFFPLIFTVFSLFLFGGESKMLSGAFFQLGNRLNSMNDSQWQKELQEFKDLGMDTVIVQYSAYNDFYYFPSEYDEIEDGSLPDESLVEIVWEGSEKCKSLNIKISKDDEVEWVILPEIQIFSNGKNIASSCEYSISPRPSQSYPDRDKKLVDGVESFSWSSMIGWQKINSISIRFELPEELTVEKVRIPFMRSTVSGVDVPASGYELSFSADGNGFKDFVAVKPVYPESEQRNYPIPLLMDAAEKLGLRVFLGLALDSSYWDGEFSVKDQARYNKNILKELYNLYKDNEALAGWYLPEEIDDRNFQTAERIEDIKYYLGQMTSYAKMLSKKPVMISPYFGINPDGEKYAQFWDDIFSKSKVGIFAMQDGVGTKRTTAEESAEVYKSLKPVMEKYGVEFWANLEVFEQTHGWPVDFEPWASTTASIERVEKQIELMSPYVSKLVIFDYPNYMSPETGSDLYGEYSKLLKNK